MFAIDSTTLDLVEWLCRRFQVLTGRTNIWLAAQLTNLSIVVYFVWVVAYIRSFPGAARIAVGLFCAGLLYVLSQTVFKVSIEGSERNAFSRVAKGLRNPRRVRDAPLRISFLTLSVVGFYPFLVVYINLHVGIALLTFGYPLIVLTTVILYLLACDPLPPAAEKARESLREPAMAPRPASESMRVAVRRVRSDVCATGRRIRRSREFPPSGRAIATEDCLRCSRRRPIIA